MAPGGTVAQEWGPIVINLVLSSLAFLTAGMITRFFSTQRDHERRLSKLETGQEVHAEMHRACTCIRGGKLDA